MLLLVVDARMCQITYEAQRAGLGARPTLKLKKCSRRSGSNFLMRQEDQ